MLLYTFYFTTSFFPKIVVIKYKLKVKTQNKIYFRVIGDHSFKIIFVQVYRQSFSCWTIMFARELVDDLLSVW